MGINNKILFVCDTPFQVLNAINFVANDLENSKGKSDIYIINSKIQIRSPKK